jgi:predicted kinase
MKSFLEKLEADSKTKKPVVMAFGRMNPPTIGHEKLVNRVKDIAKDYNAPHHVIISHTMDTKKNPLAANNKLKHAKRFFPDTNIEVSSKEKPTFLQHAAALHAAGHDHLIMVAGSDRIPEYEQKLKQYNGIGQGKLFNFKKIEVKSAGQRDPDSEGAEGMSASKMREHAVNNRFNDYIDKDGKKKPGFKSGIPSHVPEKHAKELFRDVRKGLGINEDFNRGLFKAIFVTGGPGSGKDIIIREAIAESKSVELNSVQAFDILMDKQKLSEKSNDVRREAIRNRGPLIINGPADDNRLLSIKEELEELGYETSMVFVDTTNEASKNRNEKLAKMIAESVRYDKWKQAQACKLSYSEKFENFINFNNSSTLEEIEEDITDTYEKINRFIENKNYNEIAFSWLESRGKINIAESYGLLFKEDENVKKNSRFFENYKSKRNAGKTSTGYPKVSAGSGSRAAGPSDIPADNRAGDPNADNIKWDANKRTGSYIFRTYTEENTQQTRKNYPEPQETNFSKDKEKIKKKGLRDSPTVSQRLRNVTSIGPEFDTRQQGTVYPMSGLGDVTYREETNFHSFRNKMKESFMDPGDNEMGVAGVLNGATNKEPIQSPKDNIGITIEKKKKKK